MAERMLLANAQILTCSGDADEKPFNGDVLIEGNRIARVAPGRIDVDPAAARVVDLAARPCCRASATPTCTSAGRWTSCSTTTGSRPPPPAKHMLDVAAVARTFLESGYTLIIGAGTTAAATTTSWPRTSIERGLMPGPRIVPSGPMVTEADGLGADGGLMEVVADAAAAQARSSPASATWASARSSCSSPATASSPSSPRRTST